MCIKAAEESPYMLKYILDQFKTQEMCIKAVEPGPWQLYHVPDHFKTQEMCGKAVRNDFFYLQYVPDWFVTQQQVKIWYNDDDYDEGRLIEWYDGYKNAGH